MGGNEVEEYALGSEDIRVWSLRWVGRGMRIGEWGLIMENRDVSGG